MQCRLCQKSAVDICFDFGKQPIAHHLLKSEKDNYHKYPFLVGYCTTCSLMQLIDFIEPDNLYKNYFTVSGWKSQPHAQWLIHLIKVIFDVPINSKIIEIGCNDGTFLDLLVSAGFNTILGYEPTLDAYNLAIKRGHNVVNDFF